jgi:NADH dehydrogenase
MILVTGPTGFIGRVLGRSLDHAGHDWKPFSGRLNEPELLRDELEGVETVIHLAGAEARGSNRLLRQVDIAGTRTLIDLARQADVRRLIVPSRLNADPHATHSLLRVKGEVERMVRESRIPYTIMRTSTLFGRNDRFSEIIASLAIWSWPLAWVPGGSHSPMQPLWVEDYVHCLIQTLDRFDMKDKLVLVAGDELFSYREVVKTILHIMARQRILFPVPIKLMVGFARVLLSWWYWPPVSRYYVDRLFAPEVAELDLVQRQFGFRPARFAETITYLNRPGMRWRLFRR